MRRAASFISCSVISSESKLESRMVFLMPHSLGAFGAAIRQTFPTELLGFVFFFIISIDTSFFTRPKRAPGSSNWSRAPDRSPAGVKRYKSRTWQDEKDEMTRCRSVGTAARAQRPPGGSDNTRTRTLTFTNNQMPFYINHRRVDAFRNGFRTLFGSSLESMSSGF